MKIAGIGDNVIDRYMNMGIMFPGGNRLLGALAPSSYCSFILAVSVPEWRQSF